MTTLAIAYVKLLGENPCPPPMREPSSAIGPYTAGEPGVPDGGVGGGDGPSILEVGPGSSGLLGSDVVGDVLQCNIATGEITFEYPVLPDLVLRCSSFDKSNNGSLGLGWTHGNNIVLNVSKPYRAVITDGHGWRSVYRKWKGEYVRPVGRMADLIETGGSYELRYHDGSIITFTNQPFGGCLHRIKSYEDRFGKIKRFAYSDSGFLTNFTTAFGRVINIMYNEHGKIESIVHPNNEMTKIYYMKGSSGMRLKNITDPLGNTIKFGYAWTTSGYPLNKTILKNGRTYRCDYDDDMRVLKDHDGEVMFRLGASSFPDSRCEILEEGDVSVTDGRGNVWKHTRNMFGRRTQIEYPDGSTHLAMFSDEGWLIYERNALGNCRYYYYDEYGNIVSYIDELQHGTGYGYDYDSIPGLRTYISHPSSLNMAK
jgi:YD repeat-containing protein